MNPTRPLSRSIIFLAVFINGLWCVPLLGSELQRDRDTFFSEAIADLKAGQAAQAFDHLNQALRPGEHTAPAGAPAEWIFYYRAAALVLLGQPEAALRDLENALILASAAGRWPLIVTIHNKAAEIWSSRGDPILALDVLSQAQKALSRLKAQDPLARGLQARIHANQGIAHYQLGQFNLALDHFKGAQKQFDSQAEALSSLIVGIHIANACQNLGMAKEAADAYAAAAAQAEQMGDEKTKADALSGLAVVYQVEGRLEEALAVLERAMTAHLKADDIMGMAVDKNNLGQIYEIQERFDQARRYYLEALGDFRQLKQTDKEGIALANLGYLHLLEAKYEDAQNYLHQARKIFDRCHCPKQRATIYEYMGRLYSSLKAFDQAAVYFEAARRLSEEINRTDTLWRSLAGLGSIKRNTGELQDALSYYRRSVATIEQTRKNHIEKQFRGQYLFDKQDVYNALIRLLLMYNDKYAALENLDQRNQWLLRDQIDEAVFFQNPRRQAFVEKERALFSSQKSLETRLNETRNNPDAFVANIQHRLVSQQQETSEAYRRVLLKIKKEDPILYRGLCNDNLNLPELIRNLPSDAAVIAYFLNDEDLFIFSITSGGLELSEQKGVGPLLREETRRLRQMVSRPPGDLETSLELFLKSSFSFYEILIAPLGTHILNKKHLSILPDEFLWTIPFSAIARQTQQGIRYLVDHHSITLINSLADFSSGHRGRFFKKRGPSIQVAAFGNPDGMLPAAGREALLAKKLDPRALIFSGSEANKENLRQYARRSDILIIAAHAYHPPLADRTFIGLAPAKDDDGQLKANDIRGLDLSGVELVILSGCGTALSHEGEKVFLSLADAFLFAGAERVIATLWDISDSGTYEMMTRFTDFFKASNDLEQSLQLAQQTRSEKRTEGKAKRFSAALRGVQYIPSGLQRPQSVPVDLSHPYYWAPFCLIKAGVDVGEP